MDASFHASPSPFYDGPEPASKARLRLWLRLLKVSRRIEARVRERLRAEHGTTLPRFDVMAALWRAGEGLRMSDLSGVLRVSNGNVTGIVDRLAADGLVERRPVPGDRRALIVGLTDTGRAVFAGQAAAHEGWIDGLLGALGPDEAVRLQADLGAIAEFLEEEHP